MDLPYLGGVEGEAQKPSQHCHQAGTELGAQCTAWKKDATAISTLVTALQGR